MSERENNDYTTRTQVFLVALIILLLWFADSTKQDSQMRDLQRRVGTLEQVNKR